MSIKRWLIVGPISVENQIHLEHVSPPRPVGSPEFLPSSESSAVCSCSGGKSLLEQTLTIKSFAAALHWSYISLSCAVCPTLSIGVGCLRSICFLLNSNKCFSMQLSNAPHVDDDDDGDKNEDDDQGRLGVFILSVTSIEDMGRREGGYWGHHHRISNLEGEKWRPAFNVAPNFIQCPCPPGSRFQTQ